LQILTVDSDVSPASQLAHDEDPDVAEYLPPSHARHDVGEVDRNVSEYDPAVQFVHAAAPALE
jgi:hypothetical protein